MRPEPGWERWLGEGVGLRLFLGWSAGPGRADWTDAERAQLERLPNPLRRAEWKTGRTALKHVRRRLGLPADTSELRFPDPRFSLSHCAGEAVAIGAASGDLAGVGVDLQCGRPPRDAALRWFLTDAEVAFVQGDAALRLWTVKEALFKADPANSGRILRDYRLLDPGAWRGQATAFGSTFRYATVAVPDGFLSVAIRRREMT